MYSKQIKKHIIIENILATALGQFNFVIFLL